MESLWKDHDANNKINLMFNCFCQPCGLKACKLTNFIGTLVKRKEISLTAKDWSKVAKADKEKLWLTVQVYQQSLSCFNFIVLNGLYADLDCSQAFFNVDESFKPWVLRSTSKKWKDFKVVLKRTFFNPNITRRQNICNGCGQRIPDQQWEWLVRYWKTSPAQVSSLVFFQLLRQCAMIDTYFSITVYQYLQAKSEKNKAIRAMQLNGTHTTGSKSFAVTLDELVY